MAVEMAAPLYDLSGIDPALIAQIIKAQQSGFNPAWITAAATLAALALNALVFVIGAKVKSDLDERLNKDKNELQEAIKGAQAEVENKFFHSEEVTGEALRGMREHANQIQLDIKDTIIAQKDMGNWVRDHFVNMATHDKATEMLGQQLTNLGQRIDSRMDRLENRLNH